MRSRLRMAVEHLAERIQTFEMEVNETLISQATELRSDGAMTRAAVLQAIVKVGRRQGISGIARLLNLSKSHTTGVVQLLEDDGCCHRIVQDGRTTHAILLTQAGATLLSEIEGIEAQVESKALAALDVEERQLFGYLLGKAVADDAKATLLDVG